MCVTDVLESIIKVNGKKGLSISFETKNFTKASKMENSVPCKTENRVFNKFKAEQQDMSSSSFNFYALYSVA